MTTIPVTPAESNTCDVLVVGLGPVGAIMSGLLRTKGLKVIAIDREADIYPLPRAAAFDGEAMRVFQMIGLADALQATCRVLEGYQLLSASRETLMEFRMPAGIGPYGWDMTYAFHQPDVERALRNRLAELGVDMQVSTRLTSFTESSDGVMAQVVGPIGERTIDAKYIVGCDGANSPVRDAIGGGAFDYGFSEYWLVIDAEVDGGTDLPKTPVIICDPARPTMLSLLTGARYRWEFMLKPGEDPNTFDSEKTMAGLLAPWNVAERIKVERRAVYRFRGQVANRWRRGRALVAGDAAHLMPPFLGQGMCSGIRDAVNIAWKIQAVVGGGAADVLLDTYQEEREPHVRGIIEKSIEIGKTVCVLDSDIAARRDAGMLAMQAAGHAPPMVPLAPLSGTGFNGGQDSGELFIQPVAAGRRLDDELNGGAWLISRKAPTLPADGLRQWLLGSAEAAAFDAPLRQWLSERSSEAVLVRPDRHIFGVGHPDALVTAWRQMLANDAGKLATQPLRFPTSTMPVGQAP